MEKNCIIEGDRNTLDFNLWGSIYFWLIRPVTKADTLWALQQFDKVESISLLPYFRIKEAQKGISKDFDSIPFDSIPWSFYISKNLFPNFASSWLKEAILEAVMGTAQIGLARKIYKNQKGHFPENIAALVPDILAKEPIDPFTGNPYIYKIVEDGFVVYSVGSNEKDDDERATFQVTKLVMEIDDDWPWREKIN